MKVIQVAEDYKKYLGVGLFAMVAILLAATLMIGYTSDVLDDMRTEVATTTAVTNESVNSQANVTEGSSYQLANEYIQRSGFHCTECQTNFTDDNAFTCVNLSVTDWSLDELDGVIKAESVNVTTPRWNCSYSYYSDSWGSYSRGIEANLNISKQTPIMGTVIIVAAIIAMLLMILYMFRR